MKRLCNQRGNHSSAQGKRGAILVDETSLVGPRTQRFRGSSAAYQESVALFKDKAFWELPGSSGQRPGPGRYASDEVKLIWQGVSEDARPAGAAA